VFITFDLILNMKHKLFLILFSLSAIMQMQAQDPGKKLKLEGKLIDQSAGVPLEFATLTVTGVDDDTFTGTLTDLDGKFMVELSSGKYNLVFEYLAFESLTMEGVEINENTNLGTIEMTSDSKVLDEVVVTAERTTVEIKLDKKIYNIGQDLMNKGGNATDVLDNVPSVMVDGEGNITLRGSEGVQIFIDGRPVNAVDISEALRMIPAESLDKIELITNPSARYEASGTSGIINIVLKKGRTGGFNGMVTLTGGSPANNGVLTNLSYKTQKYNFFTSQGLTLNHRIGNFLSDAQFLDPLDGSISRSIVERRNWRRENYNYNGTIGADWYINDDITLTTSAILRYRDNGSFVNTNFDFFDGDNVLLNNNIRENIGTGSNYNYEFIVNYLHKFKKDGHQLSMDASFSENDDIQFLSISDVQPERNDVNTGRRNQLYQLDYVRPINGNARFEAGYRGNFIDQDRDFLYEWLIDDNWVNQEFFTNYFEYKEFVNALYAQYGSKIDKFNYLLGLRWEDSNIHVNQHTAEVFENKRYNNFFPSAFLNYEPTDRFAMSLSYSRRIQRPWSRALNPFSEINSNLNIFRGNPDLEPVFTDAAEFGFLQRWDKVSLNGSVYWNQSSNAFQWVRRESGITLEDDSPVIFTGPVNVGQDTRVGVDFTLNYNPTRKIRVNGNFNLYMNESKGEYVYTDANERLITVNLDNQATTWFTRINSRITLPYKIEWQTNFTYNAPMNTFQGRTYGIAALNLGVSKDIMKDKATVNLNVNDVFNSRRRIFDAFIPNFMNSYVDMQWRVRQVTASFTYRINVTKNERDKRRTPSQEFDGGGEMM
jgi:outer membrane receptor for ferrienterochelin and colicins